MLFLFSTLSGLAVAVRRLLPVVPAVASAMVGTSAGAIASPQVYAVDPVHSSVVFRVMHKGLSLTYGRFNDLSGEIEHDREDLASFAFDVRIDPASVDTKSDGRDDHLRGEDFFDVARHPEIRIRSTGAKPVREGVVAVEAELTLLEATRAIRFEVEETSLALTGAKRGYHAEFTIQRSAFGMGAMLGGIGDEVAIMVSIEAVPRREEARTGE